jgi:low temperature requirement protein LtrA
VAGGGAPLFGGVALYLAGELLFKQRTHGTVGLPRLVALPPLLGLAVLVLILAALIVIETTRYAQARRRVR